MLLVLEVESHYNATNLGNSSLIFSKLNA